MVNCQAECPEDDLEDDVFDIMEQMTFDERAAVPGTAREACKEKPKPRLCCG